ncbi:CDP-ribitol ribitolphosphotransferase [Amphibacillus marinus]|uniref:CDP-ribitol ribitolphosphotransferase n=1 Tax=Amphibacillus marinus TaxID=872970 RepID=A0A1H8N4R5_9BACI|nr:CDP-glycerol glycerophosphotransferase family protein [Amphibacillus marinus]SEO24560.1 CDP-ribitol ribitolphosphotransferase [Amphibacillus marinus]
MIRIMKRAVKKIFFRQGNRKLDNPIIIDGEQLIIRPENTNGNANNYQSDLYIPKRKVTKLEFNGAQLYIKGYYYLQGIEMDEEDLVKKDLVLFNNNTEKYRVTLRDIPISRVNANSNLEERYRWSGFEGHIDFSKLSSGNKPIEAGDYTFYIELEILDVGNGLINKLFSLGNIESYFINGFHSTKMDYFTANRELKYNLIATYDYTKKTLKISANKLKDIDPRDFNIQEKESNDFWYKVFKKRIFNLVYILFCVFPIKKKKVLFASDSRDELSGNFKYVYEEMLRQNLALNIKFILRSSVDKKKTISELVHLAYEIATSKFIVLDDFFPMIYNLRIRKSAELVQLWHAVGAFKTFGFSRIGMPGGPSPKSKNHRNYTKVTVSSSNIIKHYAEGFGVDAAKVLPTGIPRTDIFFDEKYEQDTISYLHSQYPFLKGKKVITFAPTFRGNGQQSAYYDLDALNFEKLYQELSDEYVFIFKLHPFVKNDLNIPYMYKDFFYDFSDYREINDLLFVTDILITDYSSVCFEFALLNKPMLFFAYDVEEYVRTRDFYFDYLSFIPGPLIKSTSQLIKTITEKDFKMEKIPPFIDFFFDDVDGKSSKRVVEKIFK